MSWHGITDLETYVLGAIGIILLPGPNSLYILSVATARGVREGYKGVAGVFLGDAVLLALTGLGAAGLLHAYPSLFMVVKYAGAAYLAWIGLNLIIASVQSLRSSQPKMNPPQSSQTVLSNTVGLPAHRHEPFRRALLVSILNPKAIVFLLSFFIQFIDPLYPQPVVPFLILSGIIMGISLMYLSALIFVGARLAQSFRQRKRMSASLSSAVGGLFIWFAAKLATANLG